ncbi:MAG: hypothetical protein NPIRA05_13610 [Nitrospirales bacterium]|nr:MAG: hypothetical protein NPIRA05_13610 [Nitrospirales bacterium]
MKMFYVLVALLLLVLSPVKLMAFDEIDIYFGAYAQGSIPSDSNKHIQSNGESVQRSSVHGGLGGGIKIGLFPDLTKRMVGIEFEYGGHSVDMGFQQAGGMSRSRADVIILQSTVNLLFRYPHKILRPYVGIGAGSSSGILIGASIDGRRDKSIESAMAFTHQFLAGVHSSVSQKVYLFGEWKYVSANYHWKALSVDYRSQSILGGVGFQF